MQCKHCNETNPENLIFLNGNSIFRCDTCGKLNTNGTKIKIFVTSSCPKCNQAKWLHTSLSDVGITTEIYNTELAEGLGESAFYGIKSVPAILIVKEDDIEVKGWQGEVPDPKEVMQVLIND